MDALRRILQKIKVGKFNCFGRLGLFGRLDLIDFSPNKTYH
jgi:hypothetical protein